MILNHADAIFLGKDPILRVYCNKKLVWSLGPQIMGTVYALLAGYAMGRTEAADSLFMHTVSDCFCFADPEIVDLSAVIAVFDGNGESLSTPLVSAVTRSSGFTKLSSRPFAAGWTHGMIFAQGGIPFAFTFKAFPRIAGIEYITGTTETGEFQEMGVPIPYAPVRLLLPAQIGTVAGGGRSFGTDVLRSGADAKLSLASSACPAAAHQFTVTFLCDGKTLYSTTVVDGNDCPDPIIQGAIKAPGERGETYQHVFSGWTTTEGGTAEANALETVTADRFVYPVFTAMPLGTLDGESWETIASRSLDGTAEQYYSVGDSKTIELAGDGGWPETILVSIAGFNLHRNVDGVKDGITWIAQWRSSATVYLSNTDLDSLLEARLPKDLHAVLRRSTIDFMQQDITTVTGTPYLFKPELTNISDSLTNSDGGTELPKYTTWLTSFTVSLYTNSYDADPFPLFSGMEKSDIAAFFSMTSVDDTLSTRSLAYGNRGSLSASVMGGFAYDETYTLVKLPVHTAGYTFCFRI